MLSVVAEIGLPDSWPARKQIDHQVTIRRRDGSREEQLAHLKQAGIGAAIYYPLPLHLQVCCKELGYQRGDFQEAERASEEVLSLPMFPELATEEQEYVAEVMLHALSDGDRMQHE